MELTVEQETLLESVLNKEQEKLIPVNSESINIDDSTSRFSGAIWYNRIQKQEIVLAGVGGIGSYVGLLLGRLRPMTIIIYDGDKVERSNMSGQLYGIHHIDMYKSTALSNIIEEYADYYDILEFARKYKEDSFVSPIMICGFDNMEARKCFYNAWKKNCDNHDEKYRDGCLLIDGRLAAEEFQVFAIQGNDRRAMKEYEDKWLFEDSEAEETICSYKQTTFMANMIGSVIVNIFVNFVANQCNPPMPRDVPFFISYNASTMYTKVEM